MCSAEDVVALRDIGAELDELGSRVFLRGVDRSSSSDDDSGNRTRLQPVSCSYCGVLIAITGV